MNYFDFVLCKHEHCDKPFLFYAPAFSGLKRHDLVMVETFDGEKFAEVMACTTLSDDEKETIDLIMRATGAQTEMRKVLSKVAFLDFDFKEEGEDGSTDHKGE